MFREIRKSERITDQYEPQKKEYGFMKIKPESDITVEEARETFREIFEQMRREAQ